MFRLVDDMLKRFARSVSNVGLSPQGPKTFVVFGQADPLFDHKGFRFSPRFTSRFKQGCSGLFDLVFGVFYPQSTHSITTATILIRKVVV